MKDLELQLNLRKHGALHPKLDNLYRKTKE